MKKLMLIGMFSMVGLLFSGCAMVATTGNEKVESEPTKIIVYHVIVTPEMCGFYNRCNLPMVKGSNYPWMMPNNADHRKQRGRTAPNRALKENKQHGPRNDKKMNPPNERGPKRPHNQEFVETEFKN